MTEIYSDDSVHVQTVVGESQVTNFLHNQGTMIASFRVTDKDAGDVITVTALDATTDEHVIISQTQGNDINVNILLKKKLDCDPVSVF